MAKTQNHEDAQIGFMIRCMAADVIDKTERSGKKGDSAMRLDHIETDYDVIVRVTVQPKKPEHRAQEA